MNILRIFYIFTFTIIAVSAIFELEAQAQRLGLNTSTSLYSENDTDILASKEDWYNIFAYFKGENTKHKGFLFYNGRDIVVSYDLGLKTRFLLDPYVGEKAGGTTITFVHKSTRYQLCYGDAQAYVQKYKKGSEKCNYIITNGIKNTNVVKTNHKVEINSHLNCCDKNNGLIMSQKHSPFTTFKLHCTKPPCKK